MFVSSSIAGFVAVRLTDWRCGLAFGVWCLCVFADWVYSEVREEKRRGEKRRSVWIANERMDRSGFIRAERFGYVCRGQVPVRNTEVARTSYNLHFLQKKALNQKART